MVTSGSVHRFFFWRAQPQVSLRGAWSVATGDLLPLTTVRRFPNLQGSFGLYPHRTCPEYLLRFKGVGAQRRHSSDGGALV